MNLRKLNKKLDSIINESYMKSDNIYFDSFPAGLGVNTEVMFDEYEGGPKMMIFLNSSMGSLEYAKSFNRDEITKPSTQVREDAQKITDELKSLCDAFDNDIKAILNKYGYNSDAKL